jgi:hypothetical protein
VKREGKFPSLWIVLPVPVGKADVSRRERLFLPWDSEKTISKESKIKLVESLNFDIKNNIVSKNDWIDKLCGSFVSDKPVEPMISKIRSDRRFGREILGL